MSYAYSSALGAPVASQAVQVRAQFITRTYGHLLAAALGFTAIEVALFKSGWVVPLTQTLLSGSWLLVLGGFMVVGMLASRFASPEYSLSRQYSALTGYVVAEAVMFAPLLVLANQVAPGAIQSAALVTVAGFVGLSAVAFTSRRDFSFLGSLLRWAGIVALVAIAASVLFGFTLGTWFSVGMVGLAGASILYNTSNVLRSYPENGHVAASLQLFASVAVLFWYVLRLFISLNSNRE